MGRRRTPARRSSTGAGRGASTCPYYLLRHGVRITHNLVSADRGRVACDGGGLTRARRCACYAFEPVCLSSARARRLRALLRIDQMEPLRNHHRIRVEPTQLVEVLRPLPRRHHAHHLGEHVIFEIRHRRAQRSDDLRRLGPPARRDRADLSLLIARKSKRLDRLRNELGLVAGRR